MRYLFSSYQSGKRNLLLCLRPQWGAMTSVSMNVGKQRKPSDFWYRPRLLHSHKVIHRNRDHCDPLQNTRSRKENLSYGLYFIAQNHVKHAVSLTEFERHPSKVTSHLVFSIRAVNVDRLRMDQLTSIANSTWLHRTGTHLWNRTMRMANTKIMPTHHSLHPGRIGSETSKRTRVEIEKE